MKDIFKSYSSIIVLGLIFIFLLWVVYISGKYNEWDNKKDNTWEIVESTEPPINTIKDKDGINEIIQQSLLISYDSSLEEMIEVFSFIKSHDLTQSKVQDKWLLENPKTKDEFYFKLNILNQVINEKQ